MQKLLADFEELRSKHQELESVLDQKETEKQMIFSEMLQSKERQDMLEQRLSKMVGVLMKACHSIGIGAMDSQDLRGMQQQQITNDGGEGQRSYKRARLTVDTRSNSSRGDMPASCSPEYSQTDEWLESLVQGMNRVTGTQMRITNSECASPHLPNQPNTRTETHDDVPYLMEEIETPDDMPVAVPNSKDILGEEALASIGSNKNLSSIPSSPRFSEDDNRLAIPNSPLETIKPDIADTDDLARALDSQTLDLDSLLSSAGSAFSNPFSGVSGLPLFLPGMSCGQAAELARQGKSTGGNMG